MRRRPTAFSFASAYNSFSRLENCVQNYLPDALDRMVSSVPVGRSRLSLIEPVLELIQSTRKRWFERVDVILRTRFVNVARKIGGITALGGHLNFSQVVNQRRLPVSDRLSDSREAWQHSLLRRARSDRDR